MTHVTELHVCGTGLVCGGGLGGGGSGGGGLGGFGGRMTFHTIVPLHNWVVAKQLSMTVNTLEAPVLVYST